jgi:hypothetical protein
VVVSLKSFVPGARLKENGAGGGACETGLSFSLSFSSGAALSEPKSVEVFGGLPKSKVLVPGRLVLPLPLPPKEKVPEVLEGANAPREKGGVGSASFGVWDVAGLNREDEDAAPVKLEKGEDEAVDRGLGSEDAGADDGKPKGDGSVVGAAELEEDAKPAKLGGGIGIVAGVEVASLEKENEAEDVLGGLGALCVFAWEDLPSYSCCTDTRCFLYCSKRSTMSTKGSDSKAFETADRKDELSPRREV